MAYGELNGHVIDDVRHPKGQTRDRDPNTIRAQYLENSCRFYAIYQQSLITK